MNQVTLRNKAISRKACIEEKKKKTNVRQSLKIFTKEWKNSHEAVIKVFYFLRK